MPLRKRFILKHGVELGKEGEALDPKAIDLGLLTVRVAVSELGQTGKMCDDGWI